jgi:hypothetical protein
MKLKRHLVDVQWRREICEIRQVSSKTGTVTGSWYGSAIKPMDQGKFQNWTSTVWINVFEVAILMD